MPSVIKITSSMFPELYGSLLREWNPALSEARWKLAFENRWTDEDYFGHALTDQGKIVGMLGMLFSRREINGKAARFCNLHAWYVKPEYRVNSLLLMRPVLALTDHTITDFTPSERVCAVSKRLGFAHLDGSAVAMPQLPRARRDNGIARCDLQAVTDENLADMAPADVRIYKDHRDVDCGQLLVRDDGRYCHIVYSRVDRPLIPYCNVHYLSNPRLFAEHHATIRSRLMRDSGARYVVVDARMLASVQVPFSFRVRTLEKLYRSNHMAPPDIDSLYSEMVLFRHSVFPGLRDRLRATAARYTPGLLRRYLAPPA
jgi:hypothetical protein